MIRAYVGLLGQGKTISMVYDAVDELRQKRRVYTNTPFYASFYTYKDFLHLLGNKKDLIIREPIFINRYENFLQAILQEKNALFCIDEANILFNARNWKQIPPEFLARFAQSRKVGIDIFYTTQRFKHTEKRLRDLTNVVVECNYKSPIPFFPKKIYNKFWNPERYDFTFLSDRMSEKFLMSERTINSGELKKLFKTYDTNYQIEGTSIKLKPTLMNTYDIEKYRTLLTENSIVSKNIQSAYINSSKWRKI